jgi:hypothetical protein
MKSHGAFFWNCKDLVGWRQLVRLRIILALPVMVALQTSHAAGASHLPQRNLLVSWRMQSDSEASRDTRGLQRGAVVVDTQGGMRAQGVVIYGSAQAQASGQGEMQVLVLNGGQARLSLGQQRPYTQWQWLAGLQAPTSASSPAAQATATPSLQVFSTTTWVDTGQGLRVRPSWGGGKAVTLELDTQTDVSNASRGLLSGGAEQQQPPERLQAQTTLQLPLDQWVTVARTGGQQSRSQQGSWSTSEMAQGDHTVLQVKVSLP